MPSHTSKKIGAKKKSLSPIHKKPHVHKKKVHDQIAVRRSGRAHKEVKPYGEFATDDQLRAADPYLMDIMRDDVATGRPGAFSSTWGDVYMNKVATGWKNIAPPGSGSTPAVAHTLNCGEPTCLASSRLIELNAQFQELNAGSTPKGRMQRPPICHKVPWAALKAYLDHYEMKYSLTHRAPFVKDYCWWVANLGPGHNICNARGTHTTSATVSGSEMKAAEGVHNAVVSHYTNLGIPIFEP